MDDEAGIDVNSCLQVVGWRLWPFADPHRPSIELTLHQSVALFAIELSGELIEFDAPHPEGFKRRCRRARHFIRFAGVALIQTDQILGDPAIETGSLFRNLSPGACRCPKLGAVERHQARREKALISTEQHKGSAGRHDRCTVVASKVR